MAVLLNLPHSWPLLNSSPMPAKVRDDPHQCLNEMKCCSSSSYVVVLYRDILVIVVFGFFGITCCRKDCDCINQFVVAVIQMGAATSRSLHVFLLRCCHRNGSSALGLSDRGEGCLLVCRRVGVEGHVRSESI